MKINTFPPAGTRDFFPSNLKLRTWLFDIWTKISKSYGFENYDAPIVEHAELFTRKGGDDILSEMYTFKKGGIDLALRPEMTPSLVRMIMQEYRPSPYKPLKRFSIPQCWRYETTIRGRKREHYQWNIDIFGADNVKYEIELFLILVNFFKTIGLTPNDITIQISNRKILQTFLSQLNVPDDLFEQACIIIDKIGKLSRDEFIFRMMDEIKMNINDIDKIFEFIKIKTIDDLNIFLPHDDPSVVEIQQLVNLCKMTGIGEWVELNSSIVRGLSYYTGLVFEAFFKNSEIKRSVCGGGRYDNIMKTYGHNEQIPAIGFGLGDVVILDVLTEMNLLPTFESDVEYVVVPFNDELYPVAILVSEQLRAKNKNVITYCKGGKRTNAFGYADKLGASTVIFIAPTEWADENIVVKHLKVQTIIKLKDYIDSL